MNLEMSPVHKKIGPVFKGDAKAVVEALKTADPFQVKNGLEAGEAVLSYEGKMYPITGEMVEFKEIPPENLSAADFSKGFVYVDVTLSNDLQAEGYAREIIRRIQDMRKEMDLRVEDQIRVVVNMDSLKILNLVLGQKGYIANEVRASELEMGQDLDMLGKLVKDWEVEELKLKVSIDRI